MKKAENIFIIMVIIVFFIIACIGVYNEAAISQWNSWNYYLYVVPSLSIAAGLISRFKWRKDRLLQSFKISIIVSTIVCYTLYICGLIHYQPKAYWLELYKSEKRLSELLFIIFEDPLGLLLISYFILSVVYGINYLIVKITKKFIK